MIVALFNARVLGLPEAQTDLNMGRKHRVIAAGFVLANVSAEFSAISGIPSGPQTPVDRCRRPPWSAKSTEVRVGRPWARSEIAS